MARRGSWFGGGSVSAFGAALAAALLEKLTAGARPARRLTRIRQQCLQLVWRDADVFSRVIEASRSGRRQAFAKTLKAATEIPCQIFAYAQTIRGLSAITARSIKPQFRSDVASVNGMALAAADGARALVETNLAWLNDPAYTRTIRRKLAAASVRHGR